MMNLSNGKNLADVQLRNRSLILQLLHKHGAACRKDLAEMTGLTAGAVTNLVRDLVDTGLIVEDRNYAGPRGRNAINLTINAEVFYVIGMNFSRGRLAVGISNLRGEFVEKKTIELNHNITVEDLLSHIDNVIPTMLTADNHTRNIIGVGIGVPGPINISKGHISRITNLPGWEQVPIKQLMQEKFKIPILLEHDANAATLAESLFGAGKHCRHFVTVLVGKGVGAGIINNGNLYHGSSGLAGEIGHTSINFDGPPCECGNLGCLELYASTSAFTSRVQKAKGMNSALTIGQVRQMLDAGDVDADRALIETATYLGYGVVNVLNSYNPEMVVLGGEIVLLGEKWLEKIVNQIKTVVGPRVLSEVSGDLIIEYSRLGSEAVLFGAIALIINYLFSNPLLEHFKNGIGVSLP